MSSYGDIEDAIAERLLATLGEGEDARAPLFAARNVVTGLAGMSLEEIAKEVRKRADGNSTPAALILYAGSETGETRPRREDAMFWVIVICAGRSRKGSTAGASGDVGIYALLDDVRSRLNEYFVPTAIQNPLEWRGNERFTNPDVPETVSAYYAKFAAPRWWT